MSNFEGPQFDALTPEQLGEIDPAVLETLGTPGSVQVTKPIYKPKDIGVKTVVKTEYIGTGKSRIKRTTYSDGTTTEEAAPVSDDPDDGGGGGEDIEYAQKKTNAFSVLKDLLGKVGLSSLTGKVQDLIAKGILDGDAILFELRDTPEYQKRFIGNVARKAKGFAELSPLVYVGLENQYRETMKANGLKDTLYDDETDFRGLIEGDVSNNELQTRIEKGYRAVMDADPEVIRQMKELYKVDIADIAQFFLDPKKTAPELERKAQAVAVAARAKEQGKMQLSSVTAEELVSRGYSESQALQAFSLLSEGAGLYNEMAGEAGLTEGQKIGSAFGYDTDSRQALQKRASLRKSAMSSSSKFTSTTGATSGTTETGLNVAQ